jgi:hypothetical protein
VVTAVPKPTPDTSSGGVSVNGNTAATSPPGTTP